MQLAQIDENMVGIVSVVTIFVLFPLVIAAARLIWRRANPTSPKIADDSARRLVEMQQTLDAMAVEIERISEGQRFVTKLMSERAPAALPTSASSRSGREAD